VRKRAARIIDTTPHKLFRFFNGLFLLIVALTMLLPMLSVLKDSVDLGGQAEIKISLIPRELTGVYYRMVFANTSVFRPFINSIAITAVGTLLGVFINAMAAYTMSRRELRGSRFFVYSLVVIPLVFGGGGIIADYLWLKTIKLLNTYFVMVLPFLAVGIYMILLRTFYLAIPFSLTESAQLDGAGEFAIFGRIVAPLSKAAYAAIALFTGVGFWNNWLYPLLFVHDPQKYTFPVKLRAMLFLGQDSERQMVEFAMQMGIDVEQTLILFEGLSSAIIVVAALPVILIYPFLQKHFAAGVRIGAIKA
jgi:putative aldouronate transport system permease protein